MLQKLQSTARTSISSMKRKDLNRQILIQILEKFTCKISTYRHFKIKNEFSYINALGSKMQYSKSIYSMYLNIFTVSLIIFDDTNENE